MSPQGPGCLGGSLLLALAVAPVLVFAEQPWQSIATVNAATHLLTGFSWTMRTYRSETIKQFGIFLWFLTIPASTLLLILALAGVGG
jgi:hypothetical protein